MHDGPQEPSTAPPAALLVAGQAKIKHAHAAAATVSVPPKVNDAVKQGHYVPYSALTGPARSKATCGEEDFVANSAGGFTLHGLDCSSEKAIMLTD
ncbi:hypothetical protein SCP_0100390 [Sparassis crispa]|uniref:Uncharacterized protein n=1 Tax=Sparassis crispa TaxID=139825 RepID=A0A401G4Q6_9APHY|nr:hypothetical protein SCP_0100390 [Sparassis crispa]GBE77167.1 hypothetical protein SCP_0100390 [Sparassis crispa]